MGEKLRNTILTNAKHALAWKKQIRYDEGYTAARLFWGFLTSSRMLSSHVFDVPNALRNLQRKEDNLIMPPSMLAKRPAPASTLVIV